MTFQRPENLWGISPLSEDRHGRLVPIWQCVWFGEEAVAVRYTVREWFYRQAEDQVEGLDVLRTAKGLDRRSLFCISDVICLSSRSLKLGSRMIDDRQALIMISSGYLLPMTLAAILDMGLTTVVAARLLDHEAQK